MLPLATKCTPQNKPRTCFPACLLKKLDDETDKVVKKVQLCVWDVSSERTSSRCTPSGRLCLARRCACTSPEKSFKINSSTLGVFAGKREKSVTPCCSLLIIHSAQTLVIDSSLNNYTMSEMCSGKAALAPGALYAALLCVLGRISLKRLTFCLLLVGFGDYHRDWVFTKGRCIIYQSNQ